MKIYKSKVSGYFWIEFTKNYYVYDEDLVFLTKEPKPVEFNELDAISKAHFFDLINIDFLPTVVANKIFETIDDVIDCSHNLHKLLKLYHKFKGFKIPSSLKICNDPHSATLLKLLNDFYIEYKGCLDRYSFNYLENILKSGFLRKLWSFHKNQIRRFTNEEPYFFHLLRVTNSFMSFVRKDSAFFNYFRNNKDSSGNELILTCLLHDILEDTKATGDDLINMIGNHSFSGVNAKNVLDNVYVLTKFNNTGMPDYNKRLMEANVGVKIIKLFDILDNISSESSASIWHRGDLMEKHIQVRDIFVIKFHNIFFEVLEEIETRLSLYDVKVASTECMKLDFKEFEQDLISKISNLSSMQKAYYFSKLSGRGGLLGKIKKLVEG